MPNDVDLFAFQIARLALAYLLHSTILLGGTWLILLAARVRSWALRERLWKLALVLPLFTAALPLPASWSRAAAGLDVARPERPLLVAESNVAQVDEQVTHPIIAISNFGDEFKPRGVEDAKDAEPIVASPEQGSLPVIAFDSKLRTGEALRPETKQAAIGPHVVPGLCYAVLTFFILGTLHLFRCSLVFARSLRDCRPVEDKTICAALDDLLRKANVRRRVRLLESAADRPPAAFGLFRWTIVLPQALIPTLKPDELRALLGHEVAHLARGDALWLWIGRVLCACFAFQPLNFLARAQLRLAAEFLSDEWAVRNSANRFALARCLTRVAEWSANFAPASAELAAVGPRTNLSERVERLVLEGRPGDSWDRGRRRWLVWAAAFAAASALEFSAPRTSLLAEPPKRAADAERLQWNESSRPDSEPNLADALKSLSAETGDLLSDLQRVNSLLKQSTPPNPAVKAVAEALESRATRLAKVQARLVGSQASTSIRTRSERNLQ